MRKRFQDKVVIVAGAGCVGSGWGNGRAIAVGFAEEGAKVFAVDRNRESMAETVECVTAAGGIIATHVGDVTDNAAVGAMVAACLDRWERLDVLVNNVGGSASGGPVEMDEAVWDSQVDQNLGDGRDTAAAVLFLASDEARFITGTEIVVDGDMTVRCG
jgi:NAD(P)-dependent dehydrogenase (short-subunit alcohol dehydrogenase family)